MRTKLFIILLAAVSLTITFSCKKIKDLLRFDIHVNASQNIPPSMVITSFLTTSFADVPTETDQEFSTQGTRADLVKEAKMKAVTLTIKSPQGEDFSFLSAIEVYIADKNGNNEKKIAFKDPVPSNAGSTLVLNVNSDVLLDSYVRAGSFKIKTYYKCRKAITESIDMDIAITISVVADPL